MSTRKQLADQARLFGIQAEMLQRATMGLVHNDAKRIFEQLTNPKPGDLVFERGAGPRTYAGPVRYNRRKISILDCVGRLIAIETVGPRGRRLRFAKYVLRTLDGRTVRWTNCSFLKIFEKGPDALN